MTRISLAAPRPRRGGLASNRRRWAGSVEPLEGRALLATFTWNSLADGDFNNPALWTGLNNTHAVPGQGDDAVAPGGNYTISVTGTATVNSFNGGGTLNVKAGTFSVTGAGNSTSSGIANLSVASGASFHSGRISTIGGSGLISGDLDVAAGGTINLNGSGNAINLEAGATLTGAGTFDIFSNLNLDAPVTAPTLLILDSGPFNAGIEGAGTLTVPSGATFDWRSGSMSGVGGATTILAGGTFKIEGNGGKSLIDRALNNGGTATLNNNGVLTIDQTAVLTNTGSFTIQDDQPINGTGTFVNAPTGTFTKTSNTPSGTTDIAPVKFNNNGTVVAMSGILQLDNGGASTGTFNSPSPAGTLEITGQGYSLNGGTKFTGAGTVHFTSGFLGAAAINLNAGVTIPNLAIDAAMVSGVNGALTVTGNLSINDGTLAIGLLTIPQGASLNLAGSKTATFSGGVFNDLGTSTISGTEQFQLLNAATFQNAGPFTIQDDRPFLGQGSFINYGTFTKTSPVGSGTTDISATFNNLGGTVVVQSGILQLDNGGTSTGTFNSPSANGTLEITGQGYTLNAGANFTGAGTVHFTSGFLGATSVKLNGAVTISNLTIDVGTVTGTGTLTVTGSLSINSATLSIGRLNLTSTSTLTLAGTNTATFDTGVFSNAGRAVLSGSEDFALTGGATFNNSGEFLILNDRLETSSNNATFVNTSTGILTKISLIGTGTTTFSNNSFQNGGVIHVISGQLLLDGGGTATSTFSVDANAALAFSRTWTLNPGTHLVGQGQFTIGAGGLGYGTLNVNANLPVPNFALLGGTLNVAPPAIFTVTALNWTGGQIIGTGALAIPAGGTLNISGSANKVLSAATLSNAGIANWSGTGLISLDSGATIFNLTGATFNITNDQSITGGSGGTFNNSGTFNKTSLTGVGTTTLTVVLNDLAGSVINLNSGKLATSSLVNLGTINLAPQTALIVSGNFDQTFAGALNVAVAGAPVTNLFGQLFVTGQANLNGTLNVSLASNFKPAVGQVTPILAYGSAVGKFASVNLPTVGFLPVYTAAQKSTEYDLTAAVPPAPTGLALAASSQSGGPNVTRSSSPVFTGTAQAFSGVQVYSVVNNVFTLIATATAGADGSFSTTTFKTLAPGTYSMVALAYNALGGGPNSSPFSLTVLA